MDKVDNALIHWVNKLLTDAGMTSARANLWDQYVLFGMILIVAYLIYLFFRYVVYFAIKQADGERKARWRNLLLEPKVLMRLMYLVPVAIVYGALPVVFPHESQALGIVEKLCILYIIVATSITVSAMLESIFGILQRKEIFRNHPLKGLLQVCQIILWMIAAMFIISNVFDKSPGTLLAGIGASAAVLMLIFRDSILGFVAGVQLAANDMLRPGDWISIPNRGIDGTVIDVTLNTVKIENWDNTVTTVPPYTLVNEPFQNWRPMEESGGRRIQRAIRIDINTIKFCTPEMLERFKKIRFVTEIIADREKQRPDPFAPKPKGGMLMNEEPLTNVGLFRAYLNSYLSNLSAVNHELTFMVRQLPPTDSGVPVELYFFSRIKEWVSYEGVMADIMDHVMAMVPAFDLYAFQLQSGVFELPANVGTAPPNVGYPLGASSAARPAATAAAPSARPRNPAQASPAGNKNGNGRGNGKSGTTSSPGKKAAQ